MALEDAAFHPHLTLARWRAVALVRIEDAACGDASRGARVARVRVDHVTLYQSRLSSAGADLCARWRVLT